MYTTQIWKGTNMNLEQFKKELITWELVMVDVWASWCKPCMMMLPIIHKLEKEYGGAIKVVKVNVDDSQDVAQYYNVQSIPTIIFFLEGKEVLTIVGTTSESSLRSAIEKLIPKIKEEPIDEFSNKMQWLSMDKVD